MENARTHPGNRFDGDEEEEDMEQDPHIGDQNLSNDVLSDDLGSLSLTPDPQTPPKPAYLPSAWASSLVPPTPSTSQAVREPFDPTGQTAPPGSKQEVKGILWEEEGTVVFSVEVYAIAVCRREDNNMINATKLLNVRGMTKARRDVTLSAERERVVVDKAPMLLKGVW